MSRNQSKRGKCQTLLCENQKNDATYYCDEHYDKVRCKLPECPKTIGENVGGLLCKNHRNQAFKWGWTEGEYLLKRGQGECDLCGKSSSKLVIDHDHNHCPRGYGCSLCYRGMVCSNCNTGLGHFKDNPMLLLKAIGYLKRQRPGHFTELT